MFITKKILWHIDNIYQELITFYNTERTSASASRRIARDSEKKAEKLSSEVEVLKMQNKNLKEDLELLAKLKDEIIANQKQEIIKQHELLKAKTAETEKLHDYFKKIAEILKSNQDLMLKLKPKKTITKGDFIADGMFKMEEKTRRKLK